MSACASAWKQAEAVRPGVLDSEGQDAGCVWLVSVRAPLPPAPVTVLHRLQARRSDPSRRSGEHRVEPGGLAVTEDQLQLTQPARTSQC